MKRIRSFMDRGWEVTGFTWRRSRSLGQFEPFWNNIDLGEVANGKYLKRIGLLLASACRAARAGTVLRCADVVYARNLDCALIAIAGFTVAGARGRMRLCYEVNDIRGVFLERGVKGRIARWLERRVLRRAERLVTSSPRFKTEYFERVQGYRGECTVLENKIYVADAAALNSYRRDLDLGRDRSDAPLRIGWFGVLDCVETWTALKAVASRFGASVQIYMRGYPEYIEEDFFRVVEALDNVSFGGKFNNRTELEQMYANVDVVCGFDLKEPKGNSLWLLPNSFYESGAFCTPLLTWAGTATAEAVDETDGGWKLDLPLEQSLVQFVERFNWDEWRVKAENLRRVPMTRFAGQDQFDLLVRDLEAGSPARARTSA